MDMARDVQRSYFPNDDPNIVGNLADFINSDHKELPHFLFGNTALVKSPIAAYLLSIEGYRAVSVGGELFEASGSSMAVDFGSTISDLAHTLLLSNSIEILKRLITKLRKLIEQKDAEVRQIGLRIDQLDSEKSEIERKISDLNTQTSNLASLNRQEEKNLEQLILENMAVHSKYECRRLESEERRRRLSLVGLTINRVYHLMEDVAGASIRLNLRQLDEKRAQIMNAIEVDD